MIDIMGGERSDGSAALLLHESVIATVRSINFDWQKHTDRSVHGPNLKV